ncbi:uncharacterized protein KD926_010248 [Aspergillus affinis]|uniref:uncharacterized protein n=1 Tax=Aspergillus affinis TaxID=1070780 RepID=UPI0022FDBBAA|nr:uncharacterized protein KD926_010248 [Aspergillus affinis]KAI9038792.1 hypothetical protein KD926_010248 [Aspergillus affinis]
MSFSSPADVKVTSRQIPRWDHIPKTAINSKPLMIYHQAFDASSGDLAARFEEVGEHNPRGFGRCRRSRPPLFVEKGGLIIVPAGVGHRLLEDIGTGQEFTMVGAYPRGKEWDMCYGQPGEEEKARNIHDLDWFQGDPLFGSGGPVMYA